MTLNEAMSIQLRYTLDFYFMNVIEEIFSRIDNYNEDDINEAIDATLIYCHNEWIVAKFYNNSPKDIDWEETLSNLYNDVYDILQMLK